MRSICYHFERALIEADKPTFFRRWKFEFIPKLSWKRDILNSKT